MSVKRDPQGTRRVAQGRGANAGAMKPLPISRRHFIGAAGAAIAAVAASSAFAAQSSGRFYPGTVAAGVDVGGLPRPDAESLLREQLAAFEALAITFRLDDQAWTASATDLGITVDYRATLDSAWRQGRKGGLIGAYFALVGWGADDTPAPAAVTVDESKLNAYLSALADEIDRPFTDAELLVRGTTVEVTTEDPGVRLDQEAARRDALAAISLAVPADVSLQTEVILPAVTASDLEGARDRIVTILGDDITIVLSDREWTEKREELAKALVIPATIPSDAVLIDSRLLASHLQPIVDEVNHPPHDAVLAWDGGLYAATESSEGREVDLEQLVTLVTAAAESETRVVEVPIVSIPPAIGSNNLDALGITALQAAGTSSFAGSSEARAANVWVATEHITQAAIPPGGAFSFNRSLGPITVERGYIEGKIIAGDWYASDIGGGVCQVSTTVYRAALLAGLPFTEWHPHSFRLGFYELDGWPPGIDAAIYQPNTAEEEALDLVFVNPTDTWLLLQVRADGQNLTAAIYGSPTGYEVEISEPALGKPIPPPDAIERVDPDLPVGAREKIQVAQAGVEVTMTRHVMQDGEVIREDTFYSPYAPQPEIYLVGSEVHHEDG